MSLFLTSIHIYPVKSLSGFSLKEAYADARGFRYDRRWMLVDTDGRFVTQREIPALALIETSIASGQLVFHSRTAPENKLSIALSPDGSGLHEARVQIWKDRVLGWVYPQDIQQWFSDLLGRQLRLVYLPDHADRPVSPDFAPLGYQVSLADAYPYMILGEASLADLNNRLPSSLPMNRFRPNLVFSGGTAYEEDDWTDLQIGQVHFRGVKRCGRCTITTIDQQTASRAAEPLKTLATYRRENGNIYFGRYLIRTNPSAALVRVGDTIQVDTD